MDDSDPCQPDEYLESEYMRVNNNFNTEFGTNFFRDRVQNNGGGKRKGKGKREVIFKDFEALDKYCRDFGDDLTEQFLGVINDMILFINELHQLLEKQRTLILEYPITNWILDPPYDFGSEFSSLDKNFDKEFGIESIRKHVQDDSGNEPEEWMKTFEEYRTSCLHWGDDCTEYCLDTLAELIDYIKQQHRLLTEQRTLILGYQKREETAEEVEKGAGASEEANATGESQRED